MPCEIIDLMENLKLFGRWKGRNSLLCECNDNSFL